MGDLRIHWRERVLPPLAGHIELRDGTWRLRDDAAADATGEPAGGMAGWWPIVAGGLLLLVLAVASGRRRGR